MLFIRLIRQSRKVDKENLFLKTLVQLFLIRKVIAKYLMVFSTTTVPFALLRSLIYLNIPLPDIFRIPFFLMSLLVSSNGSSSSNTSRWDYPCVLHIYHVYCMSYISIIKCINRWVCLKISTSPFLISLMNTQCMHKCFPLHLFECPNVSKTTIAKTVLIL